jgi:predicted NAD-dependent protein-ADP-ribosyltransferase YbiA (DUF1768 family)/alkylated DNA repair dioxygenase AlkB
MMPLLLPLGLQILKETVKLTVNNKEAYDEDVNIGMFRELRDYNSETNSLYKDIVKLAILQGTYQTALSIKNVIPIEDYSAIVAPIIAPLVVDADVQAFADGYFQRNNFKDSEIWKTVHPNFFIARAIGEDVEDVMPVSEDQYGNPIYQYLATYAFPNIKELGIKSSERKILILNEKFNYLDVQEDFVIVPRLVVNGKTGVKVDMVTGRTVTDSMLSAARKKGNSIYKAVYGYQKVKHLDGTPVTFTSTYKGEDIVNHVYKLINLYGDNPLTTEYYTDFKPSVLNNNTMKVSSELPDVDVIDYFAPQIREEMMKSIPQEVLSTEEAPAAVSEITSPVPGVENITNSGLTVEQSNKFIDILQPQIIKQAYIENKARTANMMFSFGLRWAKNIPNESEKSEQAKNLGKPRPDRKQIKSKEGMTYGYYLTDQNNKPLPSMDKLQPIMDFIQSKLGIDMSNYDAMLGNIYDNNSFIHQHRDTTESITAEKYPVIVINLGADGHLEFDKDVKSTYASYKKSGQLDLTNGGIYAFGVNGESRFTFHHRIGSGLESANPLKPITLSNGQTLTNYRITLTFRRASDLEPGMPASPTIKSQPKESSIEVTAAQPVSGPSSETKINIYAGTGENAELSNFAKRPFTLKDDDISFDMGDDFKRNFYSVEQAFQYMKSVIAGDSFKGSDKVSEKIANETNGAKLKALGGRGSLVTSKEGLEEWDRMSETFMYELLLASFKQNPQSLNELFATGNATLTHTQDRGKWGKEFPKLLMEVRNELRPNQFPNKDLNIKDQKCK